MKKNTICIIVSTCILFFIIMLVGPIDYFAHGFYSEEIEYELEDLGNAIDLQEGDYEMQFSPSKRHFKGFEINLINQPDNNNGKLELTIKNEEGKILEAISVDLNKVVASKWYQVYTKSVLKQGKIYTLNISAKECDTIPYLQTIDTRYKAEETRTGNILMGYIYAQSTFTFPGKIILIMLITAVWGMICAKLVDKASFRKGLVFFSISLFVLSVFLWNYMYNFIDNRNDSFDYFQEDSESLAVSMIKAEHDGIWFTEDAGYGLGLYRGIQRDSVIGFDDNADLMHIAKTADYVLFENGDSFKILEVKSDGVNLYIILDVKKNYDIFEQENISVAYLCDSNLEIISSIDCQPQLLPYHSQYGLQGKVFRHLARYMNYSDALQNLHLLCCMLTAIVFILISFLISIKYNKLLGGVFLVTYLLSPWIINFARNLYWVEFTWFVPVLVGLFCSWKINNRRCRLISYIAIFVAVLVKCLCGYEFISTILMGGISFVLIDWLVSLKHKDFEKSRLLFRTLIVLGMSALFGFIIAIGIHASIRGQGDLLVGVRSIIEQDVLRRTSCNDLNAFDKVYRDSLNASIWETLCKYFDFSTEVITGVPGNLFVLLSLIPVCVFAYECIEKKVDVQLLSMYIVFFFASASWFCLAKAHSYIHTHMNFVLWYFGYVQICIYVIIDKIVNNVFHNQYRKQKGLG